MDLIEGSGPEGDASDSDDTVIRADLPRADRPRVDDPAPGRELEELKFLIGTSCSRLINLLMDPRADRATLGTEAAFMAEKAARLSELLVEETGGPDAPARSSRD